MELSAEDHAELVSRLAALRSLAKSLSEAFDDARAEAGAREMLDSIERMLELLDRAAGRG